MRRGRGVGSCRLKVEDECEAWESDGCLMADVGGTGLGRIDSSASGGQGWSRD